MDNVNFYNNDIAEVVDLNRLSLFPQAYQERFLEALTAGQRTVSINGVNPVILSVTPPDLMVRIPAQYFAVEGRVVFIPQTDIPITHPAPGADHDFYVYLMMRLDDDVDNRVNVNPGTFVQTPTARVVAHLEIAEHAILDVPLANPAPVPPIGPGVPGAGSNRLGFLLRATFVWDGVNPANPAVVENITDKVYIGSTGIIPHGATHVTTDPIPYPTDTNRGMGPPRVLPYWKNAISRMEPAPGSPINATPIGTNGPAGDTNYDVYNPATARGFELDFDFDNTSFQVIGTTFSPRFAAPPLGGSAGTDPRFARSDHKHLNLINMPEWRNHLGMVSAFVPSLVAWTDAPAADQPIQWPGFANHVAIFHVDVRRMTAALIEGELILTSGGVARFVTYRGQAGGDLTHNSMMVIMPLNGASSINIRHRGSAPAQYKIALLGTFGQGA